MKSRFYLMWSSVAAVLLTAGLGTLSLTSERENPPDRLVTAVDSISVASSGLIPIPDPISSPGLAGRGKGGMDPCEKNSEGEILEPCPQGSDFDPCKGKCEDADGTPHKGCNYNEFPCPNAASKCKTCVDKDGNPICQNCDTDNDEAHQPDACTTVTGISGPALVPVGVTKTFTASGSALKCVTWSGGDDPGSGSGPSHSTKWNSASSEENDQTVTATGPSGGWQATRQVTVVGVDKVVNAATNSEAKQTMQLGFSIDLKSITNSCPGRRPLAGWVAQVGGERTTRI